MDSIPNYMLIAIHVVLMIVGIWAWKRASDAKASYAPAFWLFIASQPVFIAHFVGTTGIITIRMAIVIEQTLVVVMVAWIALKAGKKAS